MMRQVYNDYLKKQRLDIIDKRREAKETENILKRKISNKQEEIESKYMDQLKSIKEKLTESKQERINFTKSSNNVITLNES